MRKGKLFKGILLATMLTLFTGTTVFASIDIDGGTWDYGYKNLYLTIYSKYYHATSIHGSSVRGAWFSSDYNVAKGMWSNASADAAFFDNHCYYCLGARTTSLTGTTLLDVPVDAIK